MAFKHPFKSWLAFYPETTQGVAPVDWNASGTLVDHLEADPASIGQSWIVDSTLNFRAKTIRANIPGVRNSEGHKFRFNFHGSEVETADTVTVVQTALARILEHCMGGQLRTKSTTCTGGSAAEPELAAMTTIVPGAFISFEDADDPGRCHLRRVVAIDALTVTLDQPLGFTPANGDKAHGCIISYIDEVVLEDSSSGSGRTFAWRLEKEAEAVWDLLGSKATMAINLPRNAPPSLDLTIMATNFAHENLTKTVWTQPPRGQAPLAIARDTKLFLQDYGVYTDQTYCVSSLTLEPGINILPVDTVTKDGAAMEGRCGFTLGQADTTFTPVLVPFDDDYEVDLQAGTYKAARFAQVAQAGKVWGLHWSRSEVGETPKWGVASNVQGITVKYRGHEDLENEDASNAKLWRSTFIVVQA